METIEINLLRMAIWNWGTKWNSELQVVEQITMAKGIISKYLKCIRLFFVVVKVLLMLMLSLSRIHIDNIFVAVLFIEALYVQKNDSKRIFSDEKLRFIRK